jgi:hypothetical protein
VVGRRGGWVEDFALIQGGSKIINSDSMKMEKRFRPLGIEDSSGMVSDLRELVSIWSDKWRDREVECEAERAWGAIMEMDIHDWRAARGAEGDFGCLEIACDTQKCKMHMQCSAAWWHWNGQTRKARQVRRYLGAQRAFSEAAFRKPEKPCRSHRTTHTCGCDRCSCCVTPH